MPSFTLYDLNPEFWARVQAKAAAEGTTVKAVILKLLLQWLGVVAIVVSTACAYHSPVGPSAPPPISTTAPYSLSAGVIVGQGVDAGRSTITAYVQNAHGVPLADVLVTFSTDVGTLTPATAITAIGGRTSTLLINAATATVIVQAGTLSQQLLVVSVPRPRVAEF